MSNTATAVLSTLAARAAWEKVSAERKAQLVDAAKLRAAYAISNTDLYKVGK
jgi:hypothetical protein